MDNSLTKVKLIERTQYMMEVLSRNEAKIRQFDCVLTIGIGFREKRGVSKLGEACIYIEVKKKKDIIELEPSQVLPIIIEDIPVDIVEEIYFANLTDLYNENGMEDPKISPDQNNYRPMLSGCQITDNQSGKGTAGVFGFSEESSSDNLGFLTCKHVLPNEDYNKVYQPYDYDDSPSIAEVIFRDYELIPGSPNRAQLDIALCKLNEDIKANNQLVGENILFLLNDRTPGTYLGQSVLKYGRTTRLTLGTVRRLGSFIPDTKFHTVVSVVGLEENLYIFAEQGDSGSALLTPDGGILGINSQSYKTSPSFTYVNANDIGYIKTKIGKKLKFPISTDLIKVLIAKDIPRLSEFKRVLSTSENGQKFLTSFIKFYPEGRNLIMNNRECMVTWIRLSGPTFVMLRKEKLSTDHYKLVKKYGGHTIEELLIAMFDVFSKYGSIEFLAELKNYHDVVINAFKDSNTLEAVVIKLTR
ncbi:hypothetical protein KCTC32516_00566 [Polaribacter huanghezhanensis]|uniref:hypothetical protein n=1 Tax=Polaribacter huanghezhanensis TaxID=1354726 RepID=UPI002649C3CC|nr:hypothetical protein [Polaribacter huanghezhanensis]WKD85226.1 hypothetical protein KCTC32516_00566 [Polaribacter huanghezhanensis]